MTRPVLPVLALVLAAAPGPAQPVPATRLTVTPAAEPAPALRYRLLPPLADRAPGNAALEYHRAVAAGGPPGSPADRARAEEKAADWEHGDPGRPPPPDVRRLIAGYARPLRDADRAARCDTCDWGLDARLRADALGAAPGDEAARLRDLGRVLALRARAEVADGDPEAAARSLQTGLQMARDVNRVPTVIHALIAASLADGHLRQVEAWVGRPGAPNLYWALSNLPRPFVDLRPGLELEAAFPGNLLPGLQKLEAGPVSQDEAGQLVGRWVRGAVKSATPDDLARLGLDRPVGDVGLAAVLALRAPAARKWLGAAGRPAAEVAAMPAAQAVYLHDLGLLREMRDDLFKWYALPYPDAREGVTRAARRHQEVLAEHPADPVLRALTVGLPALGKVHFAAARTDRRIAALRAIEAVRLHAAAHAGTAPANLAEVTAVPVPADPVTGTPFEYAPTADGFTLSAPPPAGEAADPGNSLRYEVTVRAR